MIVVSSPLRVALAGGGSDLPAWREKHGSTIVSASISLRVYVMVNHRYDGKIRVAYMETEFVDSVDDVKHDIFREVLKSKGVPVGGVEIVTVADAPARSGLGSSGAFTVALIQALNLLNGEFKSRRGVAEEAFKIEHYLGKKLGKHDQYISAFGGVNILEINHKNVVNICPVNLSHEWLNDVQNNLFMFDLKNYRDAKDPLAQQDEALRNKKVSRNAMAEIAKLGVYVSNNIGIMAKGLGTIFDNHWGYKCLLAEQDPNVKEAYIFGIRHGAIGGKLIGAGLSGFMLFYVEPMRQEKFLGAMDKMDLVRVPFKFDFEGLKTECISHN